MSGLEAIDRAPSVAAARTALEQEGRAWIVGGAIRDALLGESVSDADLAVERGREESAARAIARVAGGTAFRLSEEHATWRAIAPTGGWHLDVVALRAAAIEEDLRERDFTMNAIARPLAGGDLIDPLGGIADSEARLLRAASGSGFFLSAIPPKGSMISLPRRAERDRVDREVALAPGRPRSNRRAGD